MHRTGIIVSKRDYNGNSFLIINQILMKHFHEIRRHMKAVLIFFSLMFALFRLNERWRSNYPDNECIIATFRYLYCWSNRSRQIPKSVESYQAVNNLWNGHFTNLIVMESIFFIGADQKRSALFIVREGWVVILVTSDELQEHAALIEIVRQINNELNVICTVRSGREKNMERQCDKFL